MAELVDALASGASGRKVVEVRVFSWAPLHLVWLGGLAGDLAGDLAGFSHNLKVLTLWQSGGGCG